MLRKVHVGRMSGLLRALDEQKVGPECLTCLKPIPEASFENEPGHRPFAEVLIRCHGADEVVRLDMGTSAWTYAEAGKILNKQKYFDPHQIAGVTEER